MVSHLTSAEAQKASIFCQIFCQKNLATWTHNFHNILGCDKTQRAFLRCCDTGNVIHIMLVLLPIDMVFVLFALPIEAKYMTIGTKACCCVSGYRLFLSNSPANSRHMNMYKLQTLNSILIDVNQLKSINQWHCNGPDHVMVLLNAMISQWRRRRWRKVEVKVGPTEMEKQVGN